MIKPMLCETARKPFDHKDFIFEPKLDGVRCIAYLGDTTRLQSRRGSDITHKFPELSQIHRQARKPCILDGEITCLTFEQIQQRIHKEKPLAIRLASRMFPAIYYPFDILYVGGESVERKSLLKRKELLTQTFADGVNAMAVIFIPEYGTSLFNEVKERGLEGLVAKYVHSPYQEGKRARDWLKLKAFQEDTFYIYGLTKGEKEREKTFGSLLLGKDGKYFGNVGSGFGSEALNHILKLALPLQTDTCPFAEKPQLDREVMFWVSPELACEVRYLGVGSNGHMRFPTFRKLHESIQTGGKDGQGCDSYRGWRSPGGSF